MIKMANNFAIFLSLILFLKISAQNANNDDFLKQFSDSDRGFGSQVHWIPWGKAVMAAEKVNRPIFLLIHRSWCSACKALKKKFKRSSKMGEFVELSKQFVMVNADDDSPHDKKYAPDGHYFPRIIFLKPNGEPLPINNDANSPDDGIVNYSTPNEVLVSMKKCVEMFEVEKRAQQQRAEEMAERERRQKFEAKIAAEINL